MKECTFKPEIKAKDDLSKSIMTNPNNESRIGAGQAKYE